MASWYAMPDRIIPERGQGPENGIHPSTKQRSDVLQDDEAWSQFANKADDFIEQSGSFAGQPQTVARHADVLTGKAAANSVNGNSIGSKSLCGKCSDIVIAGDTRPVLGKDFARERFDFAEGDGFKSACSFEAKAKSSNAREKIKNAQFLAHIREGVERPFLSGV